MKRIERLCWVLALVGFGAFVYFGNGNHVQRVMMPEVSLIPQIGGTVSIENHYDIAALNKRIDDLEKENHALKVKLKTAEFALKATKKQMAELKPAPQYAFVLQSVQAEVQKKGGFDRENQRILGDIIDVSRVRLVQ